MLVILCLERQSIYFETWIASSESLFSRELNCAPEVMQMSFTSTSWLKVGIVVGMSDDRTFCSTSGARI